MRLTKGKALYKITQHIGKIEKIKVFYRPLSVHYALAVISVYELQQLKHDLITSKAAGIPMYLALFRDKHQFEIYPKPSSNMHLTIVYSPPERVL